MGPSNMNTYLEYFSYFTPLWPKLVYPFASGNWYKNPQSIIFTRSWVLIYRSFADGRMDRHFSKSFLFSSSFEHCLEPAFSLVRHWLSLALALPFVFVPKIHSKQFSLSWHICTQLETEVCIVIVFGVVAAASLLVFKRSLKIQLLEFCFECFCFCFSSFVRSFVCSLHVWLLCMLWWALLLHCSSWEQA